MDVKQPRQTTSATTDIVIIGAGVIGCAVAAAATERGHRVSVIEKNSAAGFGSTSASAGIARVHAGDRDSSVLADESIYAWEQWREVAEVPTDHTAASFVPCGSYIFDDGSGTMERFGEVMQASGTTYAELDGDELAKALPWADTRRFGPPAEPDSAQFWREPQERIEQALHTPRSGYIPEPALAAQNLADKARNQGAEFLYRRQVTAVDSGTAKDLQVQLDDGTSVSAVAVVNAAGPHSQSVNTMLGVGGDFQVRQRLIRHELHHADAQAVRSDTAAHIVDGDLGINFRPEGRMSFLVGSSGSLIDGEENVETPDDYINYPTRKLWYRHTVRAVRRIPSLTLPPKPIGVAGVYDVTEDWLPIYDRTDRPGIFVAIGTSGNQFKTAPLVGALMTELIEGSFNGTDTDGSPIHMELPYTGRRIDTSVFSRLRTPKAGGSRG